MYEFGVRKIFEKYFMIFQDSIFDWLKMILDINCNNKMCVVYKRFSHCSRQQQCCKSIDLFGIVQLNESLNEFGKLWHKHNYMQ